MLRAKRRKDGVGVSNLKMAEMHRCNNFGGWAAPSLDLATLLQARLRLWPLGACEWSMELCAQHAKTAQSSDVSPLAVSNIVPLHHMCLAITQPTALTRARFALRYCHS